MYGQIKKNIKGLLAALGVVNPARGAKITSNAKAEHILENKRHDTNIFVETGTEFGTMIQLVGDQFEKIYSIEFDKELFDRARELFKGSDKIVILQGDSGIKIKEVLSELNAPALFWLDAHGPGSMTVRNPLHCPVEKELEAIISHPVKGLVILIDDVRHFDRHTVRVIKELARQGGFNCVVEDGLFILK